MLTHTDKENILKSFPTIKLSYETITYKKVHNSDYIVAIPEGVKCFAWFTSFKEKHVCLLMELTTNNEISDIKIVNACFSDELAYGTILYGTIIYNSGNTLFYIEDIFSYKGGEMPRAIWGDKLVKIHSMLKRELKQVSYNNTFVIFGLPLLCKTNEEMDKRIQTVNYKIDKIQFNLFETYNRCLVLPYKNYFDTPREKSNTTLQNNSREKNSTVNYTDNRYNKIDNRSRVQAQEPQQNRPVRTHTTSRELVFCVRPDIQDDIYNIHCFNNGTNEHLYGVAHIPNFNTSAMMNKLFRNIKENDNLDALEESDDEEEFENEKNDKFVHMDRKYNMVCIYSHKFKKWTPIRLANKDEKVVTLNELNSTPIINDYNQKKYKK